MLLAHHHSKSCRGLRVHAVPQTSSQGCVVAVKAANCLPDGFGGGKKPCCLGFAMSAGFTGVWTCIGAAADFALQGAAAVRSAAVQVAGPAPEHIASAAEVLGMQCMSKAATGAIADQRRPTCWLAGLCQVLVFDVPDLELVSLRLRLGRSLRLARCRPLVTWVRHVERGLSRACCACGSGCCCLAAGCGAGSAGGSRTGSDLWRRASRLALRVSARQSCAVELHACSLPSCCRHSSGMPSSKIFHHSPELEQGWQVTVGRGV